MAVYADVDCWNSYLHGNDYVNKHDIILLGSRVRIIVVIDMSAYNNALSLKHMNYKNNLKPMK